MKNSKWQEEDSEDDDDVKGKWDDEDEDDDDAGELEESVRDIETIEKSKQSIITNGDLHQNGKIDTDNKEKDILPIQEKNSNSPNSSLEEPCIDDFEPQTEEQFDKLKEIVKNKLTKYEKSPLYVGFLEKLFLDLSSGFQVETVQKLAMILSSVSLEKSKLSKNVKVKKKNKKANLNTGKDVEKAEKLADDFGFDEYEDYI